MGASGETVSGRFFMEQKMACSNVTFKTDETWKLLQKENAFCLQVSRVYIEKWTSVEDFVSFFSAMNDSNSSGFFLYLQKTALETIRIGGFLKKSDLQKLVHKTVLKANESKHIQMLP